MQAPSQTFFPNAFAHMRSKHPCCRATLEKMEAGGEECHRRFILAYYSIYDRYISIIKHVCNVNFRFSCMGEGMSFAFKSRSSSEAFSSGSGIKCKNILQLN